MPTVSVVAATVDHPPPHLQINLPTSHMAQEIWRQENLHQLVSDGAHLQLHRPQSPPCLLLNQRQIVHLAGVRL